VHAPGALLPPLGLAPAPMGSAFTGAADVEASPEPRAALSLGSPSLFGALARGRSPHIVSVFEFPCSPSLKKEARA